jgi:hypothetical protein
VTPLACGAGEPAAIDGTGFAPAPARVGSTAAVGVVVDIDIGRAGLGVFELPVGGAVGASPICDGAPASGS